MDAFIQEQKLRGNSSKTVDYYEGNFARFRQATGIKRLEDLTEEAVISWLLGLQTSGLSVSSIRTYDRAMRTFCTWLERKGKVLVSPMAEVPRMKEQRTLPRQMFSPEDVRKMLSSTATKGKRNQYRDQMMVAVLLDTGMRAGELASLDVGDIHWDDGYMLVNGKTGERAVPAQKSLRFVRKYLSRERRSEGHSDRLVRSWEGFPVTGRDITVAIRRLAARAGVSASKIGPHTFRHTFALEYLRSGGDVFSLKRILGHAQLRTTEQYVQWLTGDVAELHKKHSPASRWL